MAATAVRTRVGFSLIELVITTLVIGIIAAAAVPRYSGALARYRVAAAAKRVAADLNYARREAMNQGVSQDGVFNGPTNSYAMPTVPHPDSPGLTYSVALMDTEYPAMINAPNFGGSSTVTYDIFGQPSAGGSVTVLSNGNQRTVNVDAVTGIATVP